MAHSIAKACLRFTGLYEAELLVELLLRHWNHPQADDGVFRAALLEAAAEVLRASVDGERLFQEIKPQNVNFVAAVWYAESQAVESADLADSERKLRREWLDA